MNYKLKPGQVNIVRAALHELDLQWRKGTANAGFSSKTMQLVRGPGGPCPHESEVRHLLELFESGHYSLELVPRDRTL